MYNKIPEIAENAGIKEYTYNNELLKWMGLTQNDYAKEMLYSVTGILIALIVAGTVIVIYNSFAISVSERKKQFSMLASTGATPGQIRKAVFSKAPSWVWWAYRWAFSPASGASGHSQFCQQAVERYDVRHGYSSPASHLPCCYPGHSCCFTGLIIFSAYIPAKGLLHHR